ncbi:predicted protein [Lichtheimia corymbifera JMRC:FSU:9682]|uniref:Uncharacterized protein n=1 Tax=Lichtheimia corymbifera JMRC:FSU:9682 TaxID=1263082 RepID=A0A068SIK2_9FUNG|nr:predicted protein [Lichtheimia corymbifera JMRC:FSU:9682]
MAQDNKDNTWWMAPLYSRRTGERFYDGGGVDPILFYMNGWQDIHAKDEVWLWKWRTAAHGKVVDYL